jgi:hypothetical protein
LLGYLGSRACKNKEIGPKMSWFYFLRRDDLGMITENSFPRIAPTKSEDDTISEVDDYGLKVSDVIPYGATQNTC